MLVQIPILSPLPGLELDLHSGSALSHLASDPVGQRCRAALISRFTRGVRKKRMGGGAPPLYQN